MSHILTGTTITPTATIRDKADLGEDGPLVDPDGNTVTVTVYDSANKVVETGAATRESLGVFYYNWTTPTKQGIYFVEFKCTFAGKPELQRKRYTVKFRPHSE